MSRKKKILYAMLAFLLVGGVAAAFWEVAHAPTNNQIVTPTPTPTPDPATSPPPPTSNIGTLNGHVDIGPFCPVEQVGKPCPVPAGTYDGIKILVYKSDAKTLLYTLDVDASGNYTKELAAGEYAIDYKRTGDRYPHTPEPITIKGGQTHEVDFTIDTGIR